MILDASRFKCSVSILVIMKHYSSKNWSDSRCIYKNRFFHFAWIDSFQFNTIYEELRNNPFKTTLFKRNNPFKRALLLRNNLFKTALSMRNLFKTALSMRNIPFKTAQLWGGTRSQQIHLWGKAFYFFDSKQLYLVLFTL